MRSTQVRDENETRERKKKYSQQQPDESTMERKNEFEKTKSWDI